MTRLACSLLLTFLPLLTFAAEKPSAFKALKVVPKEDVNKLARIEAQGGTPVPERWHFLVHSPESQTGIKEYVVAGGELVATREVSQFAETLTEEDVIGDIALKVDSGKLVDLTKKYAAANKVAVATVNYQLIKIEAEPIWRVNCLDESGTVNGTLVVTAAKGEVLSHEGFAVEPKGAKSLKRKKSALRFETESEELVAVADDLDTDPEQEENGAELLAETDVDQTDSAGTTERAAPPKKVASKSGRGSSERKVRPSVRAPRPVAVARRVTKPVRQIIRRVLPF